MDKKLARLEAIGFKKSGQWKSSGDGIDCDLNNFASSCNVLYAFAVDGQVMYIGKTVNSLRARMAGYRHPGPTQSTNIRSNRNIQECLSKGNLVDVYVLPDNGLLHYGSFHVNLAAGLEDSVVRDLKPAWNGGKKESSLQSLRSVATENETIDNCSSLSGGDVE